MTPSRERAAGRAWLHELEQAARARGFTAAHWGDSEGLPLLGLRRPGDGDAPRVYVSAGIHGDEPAGPLSVERLLRDDLLDPRATWTICPVLNPGGWLAGTRESPQGIDLNRDYREGRSREVAAHREWLRKVGPHDLFLSLHEDWETSGFYLYEINTSPHAPFAGTILEEVSEVLPIEQLACIDEHVVCSPGYIAHRPEPDEPRQWPEAIYHTHLYPHLSYTFETPSALDMEDRVAAHVIATRTAIREFLRRWKQELPHESPLARSDTGDGRDIAR